MSQATIIIIGNEILSGKFKDENTPWLIDQCQKIGISILRVHIIPDKIDIIAQTVREASKCSTYVFTTGGVGPTHDDLTMKAIAKACDDTMVESPELRALIERYAGNSEGARRMALVPSTYALWDANGSLFPQVVVGNIIIFPGVPKIMQKKFLGIKHRLTGQKKYSKRLFLQAKESEIAIALEHIQNQYPTVEIGSYPRFDEAIKLILTVESVNEDTMIQCWNQLKDAFKDFLYPDQKD